MDGQQNGSGDGGREWGPHVISFGPLLAMGVKGDYPVMFQAPEEGDSDTAIIVEGGK